VNHKRLFRVYRQAGLSVKRTRRKKLLRVGVAQPVLSQPNQEWSLDFVCDALGTGRAVRVLSIVDNFTRNAWLWKPIRRSRAYASRAFWTMSLRSAEFRKLCEWIMAPN
jgi:transposase InsO family protein